MKVPEFDWSDEESATKHGFSREDIESVCSGDNLGFKVGRRLYVLLGKNDHGNFVEIIFRLTDEGKARVFHCMRMRETYMRRYRDYTS